MKCKVCSGLVNRNSVKVNMWGRRVLPCKNCGLCHELTGEIARSQSDRKKVIFWKNNRRVEIQESAIFLKPSFADFCRVDDKVWLQWKGLEV